MPERLLAEVGLPAGWQPVPYPGRPNFDTGSYALNAEGVAYRRTLDVEYESFWQPATTIEGRQPWWPAETTINPSAPYVCKCGNDRLWIIYSGSYETSGKCPACGFQSVVHDG